MSVTLSHLKEHELWGQSNLGWSLTLTDLRWTILCGAGTSWGRLGLGTCGRLIWKELIPDKGSFVSKDTGVTMDRSNEA